MLQQKWKADVKCSQEKGGVHMCWRLVMVRLERWILLDSEREEKFLGWRFNMKISRDVWNIQLNKGLQNKKKTE